MARAKAYTAVGIYNGSVWRYFVPAGIPIADGHYQTMLRNAELHSLSWPDRDGGQTYLREMSFDVSNTYLYDLGMGTDEFLIGAGIGASATVAVIDNTSLTYTGIYSATLSDFTLGPTCTIRVAEFDFMNVEVPKLKLTDNLTQTGQPYCSTAAIVPQTDVGRYVPYAFGEATKVPAVLWNVMPAVLKFESGCLGTSAYHYWQIWAGSYVVQDGDYLEYDIMIEEWSPAFNLGVEVEGSGWYGRDYSLADQNTVSNHAGDLTSYAKGKWYHRKVNIDALQNAGRTITEISLCNESETVGYYIAFYANIKITNGGTPPVTRLQVYPTLNINQSNYLANYGSTVGRTTEGQIYDYLVHDGHACRIHNVYRNKMWVNPGEYSYWCGQGSIAQPTQGSYPGRTFVRFYIEQLDYSMSPYEITVDLCTAPLGEYVSNVIDGLDHHYNFESAVNVPMYDLSGYDLGDGSTYKGHTIPTSYVSGVTRVPGKVGSYAWEWTSGDSVAIPCCTKLEWHTAFSFSLWIKCSSTGANQAILSTLWGSTYGIELQINNALGGKLRFGIYSPSQNLQVDGSTVVTDNSWRHIVVAYDGSGRARGVKLYVNNSAETLSYTDAYPNGKFTFGGTLTKGVLTSPPPIYAFTSNDEYQIYLGCRYGNPGTAPFVGQIDELCIYRMALSDAKVATLWNSGNGLSFTSRPLSVEKSLYWLLKKVGLVPVWASTWDAYEATQLSTTASPPADDTAWKVKHMKASGYVSDLSSLQDVVGPLCQIAHARLSRSYAGNMVLQFDDYDSSTSGTFKKNDVFYNNIFSLESRTFKSHSSPVKTLRLQYGYSTWTGDFASSRTWSVQTVGDDLEVVNRFVYDNFTASLLGSYLRGKILYASEQWPMKLGIDSVEISSGEFVYRPGSRLLISVSGEGFWGITNLTYRIIEIAYKGEGADVVLERWNSNTYALAASNETVYGDKIDRRAETWHGDANAERPSDFSAAFTSLANGSYTTAVCTHQLNRRVQTSVAITDTSGNAIAGIMNGLIVKNEPYTFTVQVNNQSGSPQTGIVKVIFW